MTFVSLPVGAVNIRSEDASVEITLSVINNLLLTFNLVNACSSPDVRTSPVAWSTENNPTVKLFVVSIDVPVKVNGPVVLFVTSGVVTLTLDTTVETSMSVPTTESISPVVATTLTAVNVPSNTLLVITSDSWIATTLNWNPDPNTFGLFWSTVITASFPSVPPAFSNNPLSK